jgi:crossover junction endodeoxyribonuclease RuvC
MLVVGVDPGLSGAIAWVMDGNILDAVDMPVMDGRVDAAALSDLVIKHGTPDIVIVEKVGSMPGQGVASTFKFGQSYGTLLGVFGALKLPIMHVTPRKWKASMGLSSDKEMARARAIDTWPSSCDLFKRKKDHGRAEACLMAKWGQENA